MEDTANVEEIRARDGLRAAFDAEYVRLVRMCALLTSDRRDAEDIVQEAFVRVAPRLAHLPADAVALYLRRTVINLWKNRLRRLSVERRARASGADRPRADTTDGSSHEHDEVWEAIRHLPARQQACVVLRFAEDLSERDTAAALGCSIGTVKSQTSKALAKLRKELEHADR